MGGLGPNHAERRTDAGETVSDVRVIANGKPRDVNGGTTVDELIRSLGLDPRWVIVERNGEPLDRKLYGEARLADGDRLELVRAVAGG